MSIMRPKNARIAAATLVVIACPLTMAADVEVDWDPRVDHERYRTFTLREGTPLTNPLADLRIRQAVSGMLIEKGLSEAESEGALKVAVHASITDDRAMNLEGYGPRGAGWETEAPDRKSLDAGMLVVDLLDASSGALVWRGVATGCVTNNPTRNRKPIDKALAKMFRRYPPGAAEPESR